MNPDPVALDLNWYDWCLFQQYNTIQLYWYDWCLFQEYSTIQHYWYDWCLFQQYSTVQLYCPFGEIPLAVIWTRRNIKHHTNLMYFRLTKPKEKKKSPTQEEPVQTKICWNSSVIACLRPHISTKPTPTNTPPSPPPTTQPPTKSFN